MAVTELRPTPPLRPEVVAAHQERVRAIQTAQANYANWAGQVRREQVMRNATPLPEPKPVDSEQWRAAALCAEVDPEIFFPEKGGSTREAKQICARCDVRAQCLAFALAHERGIGRHGIYGGTTERERRAILSKTRTDRESA